MNFSATAKSVRFDGDSMWVQLADGRVLLVGMGAEISTGPL